MTQITDENIFPKAQPEQKDFDWLTAGIWNVVISEVTLVKDDNGNIISNGEKYSHAIDIVYKHTTSEGKERSHTERYYMGGKGQFHFDLMAKAAGIDNSEGSAGKNSALGKRIWIAIQKQYATTDGTTIELNDKGYRKGYYRIFKHYTFTDANTPPQLDGDPTETKESPTTGDFCKLLPPKGGAKQAAAPVAQANAPAQEATKQPDGWE